MNDLPIMPQIAARPVALSAQEFSGHTPGPWVVAHNMERLHDYVVREICSVTLGNNPIHVYSDASYDDCRKNRQLAAEANALLISQAPETKRQRDALSKALQDALDQMEIAQGWWSQFRSMSVDYDPTKPRVILNHTNFSHAIDEARRAL